MRPVSVSQFRQLALASFALLTALAVAGPALATPVSVVSSDLPTCDPLSGSPDEEWGNPPGFPPDEAIASAVVGTFLTTCLPGSSNVLVSITNLTGTAVGGPFGGSVWYVSDPETLLTNVDGLMNGEEAFRIDSPISDPFGINHPLVFESMAFDDVFMPGETWDFIIVDYFNALGLPASAFASVGLVGALSVGDTVSSGSIVIPEPATLSLLALGLAGVLAVGRRHK